MLVAGWLLGLLLIYVLYSEIIFKPKPQEVLFFNGSTEIKLFPSQDGHFRIEGIINDKNKLNFLVDTGASIISIPEKVAKQNNLPKLGKTIVLTAGGEIEAYNTVIENLQLGPINISNVKATIIPNLYSGDALLGMNILRKFKIEQNKDYFKLKIDDDFK